MKMIKDNHLGGYIEADSNYPNGDPATYYPDMWSWLIPTLNIKSVLDIGCGQGHATLWFLNQGLDVTAIDGCQIAYDTCVFPKDKFILHDYTKGTINLNNYDLGWCCEFVEHVSEQYVANIIDTFKHCKFLAITHAEPHQGGYHHVNEQNSSYWINLLKDFELDLELTKISKSKVDGTQQYCHWFRSGLIFRKI